MGLNRLKREQQARHWPSGCACTSHALLLSDSGDFTRGCEAQALPHSPVFALCFLAHLLQGLDLSTSYSASRHTQLTCSKLKLKAIPGAMHLVPSCCYAACSKAQLLLQHQNALVCDHQRCTAIDTLGRIAAAGADEVCAPWQC